MTTTYEALQTHRQTRQGECVPIASHPFPDGSVKVLFEQDGRFQIRWDGHEPLVHYTCDLAHLDEASAIYDGIDGRVRPWAEGYLPRGNSLNAALPKATVFAIGTTLHEAALAFADWRGHASATLTEVEAVPPEAYGWGVRLVTDDGVAYRLAGQVVPGGYIVTWWA
jgi:hypothetical protein